MGHYCRICGRQRPNEQFSGKGHRIHVCRRCQAMPKRARQAIEDKDRIFRFLKQSHISDKNLARLRQIAKSEDPEVRTLAAIALEVGRVTPYKRRRLKHLARTHPELLVKLEDTGLVFAHTWDYQIPEFAAQADSEDAVLKEDLAAPDLAAQADWDIPF